MTKKRVVVIGGGTAGLVIANKLQEHFNVTVIEKSEYKRYPLVYGIPLLIGMLYRKKVLKYLSRRELLLKNNRKIPFFESNVVGGASVINGCVHTIGSQSGWELILSKFASVWPELIESYGRSYSKDRKEKYKISLRYAPQNKIDESFIATLETLGIQPTDMEFSNDEGCGPVCDTAKRIFRSSVKSLIKSKNFEVISSDAVRRILVDDNSRVIGVETTKKFVASDYVILSAGVIGTCSILLAQEGEVFKQLNEKWDVGGCVQDHTNLRVNVFTKSNIGSLNEIYGSYIKKATLLLRHLFGQNTLMIGTGATSGVHLDLDGDGVIDTRIHVVQFSETGRHGSDGKQFMDRPGFSLSITPIHPCSNGRIFLSGAEVSVDPCYLADHRDVDILRKALAYCLRLLKTPPLSSCVLKIVDESRIEKDPDGYIYDNFYSGHHLIGGANKLIDQNFAVKGVNGMYVCDASVFDSYAASNIHSSVVLLADIFSQRFLSRHLFA